MIHPFLHELRTPLALIVGTIEMMLQEEKTGVNPRLPEQYRKDMKFFVLKD